MKRKILAVIAVMVFFVFSASAQTGTKPKNTQSTIEMITSHYEPGTTVDLTFAFVYKSAENEYVDGVSIQFPTGVTVNSATKCTKTGLELAYNSETGVGDGILASWGDLAGNSGYGALRQSGEFSVNVTIANTFSGDMVLDWVIVGDGYGEDPHTNSGTINIPKLPGANITFNVNDGVNALENVNINADGKNYITDETGEATTFLSAGEIVCNFNLLGYSEEKDTVMVVDGINDVVSISMTKLPTYSVTFNVDDFQGNLVEGAQVSIIYRNTPAYTGTTTNGVISFPAVPVGTYSYTITVDNLAPFNNEFSIVDADKNIPVTLDELVIDPYGLNVKVVNNDATFSWNNVLGIEDFYDSFETGDLSVWGEFIQGPGTPGDSPKPYWHVAESDGGPGTCPDGEYVLRSDWGFDIDTWLITERISVVDGMSLSFQWNTSHHWMVTKPNGDIFVKISLDDGDTWTTIWTEDEAAPFEEFIWNETVLDLSDYAKNNILVAFNLVASDNAAVEIDVVNISTAKRAFGTVAISNVPNIPENARTNDGAVYTFNNAATRNSAKLLQEYVVYLNGVQKADGLTETTYDFMDLPAGDHIAGVKAIYESKETEIFTKNFTIEDGAVITLNITDGTNPIEGANINLNNTDYLTDSDGKVKLFLTSAEYDYTVSQYPYETYTNSIEVVHGNDSVINITLELLATYDVKFTVANILNDAIKNTTVTIYHGDDILKTGNTDSNGEFSVNIPIGSYTYNTDADGYISSIGEFEVIDGNIEVPVDLEEIKKGVVGLKAVTSYPDATITWLDPTQIAFTPQWIKWNEGWTENAVGTNGYAEFAVAARFEPADIAEFEDGFITKISFVPNEIACTYTLKIWSGADAIEIYSQDITTSDLNIPGWNEIILTNPVAIDITKELWIGYTVYATAGYPAGYDDAPSPVAGKGNMMKIDGTWQELTTVSSQLTGNWSINAYIDAQSRKDLLGTYNVYLNGDLKTETPISDLKYLFTDLEQGIHTAGVTALYTTGESKMKTVEFDLTVDVESVNNLISIYPNPSNGVFTVSADGTYKLEVVDISGKIISTKEIYNTYNLSIKESGVYMLRLTNDTETLSYKVIVK